MKGGSFFVKLVVVVIIGFAAGAYLSDANQPPKPRPVTLEDLGRTAREGAETIGNYLNGPKYDYEPSTYEAPAPKPFVPPVGRE